MADKPKKDEPINQYYSPFDNMKIPEGVDPNKLSSEEAAALLLSGGMTTNPYLAQTGLYEEAQELDTERLIQANLRRQMGFDFRIKVRPNKIHVSSREEPFVTTHAKIRPGDTDENGNIINTDLINRLVNACIRLKEKYELEKKRLETVR